MQHPDTEQNVSPFPFRSHTALLLATALPFLQPAYRHPVELAGKLLELSETLRLYQEFHTGTGLSPSGLLQEAVRSGKESGLPGMVNTIILDVEGLLCSLSKVCSGKEKEVVTLLLNMIRAKSFYETYGDILNSFSSLTPQEETASPKDSSDNFSTSDFASLLSGGGLSSILNQEQTDTLNLLKNLLNAE